MRWSACWCDCDNQREQHSHQVAERLCLLALRTCRRRRQARRCFSRVLTQRRSRRWAPARCSCWHCPPGLAGSTQRAPGKQPAHGASTLGPAAAGMLCLGDTQPGVRLTTWFACLHVLACRKLQGTPDCTIHMQGPPLLHSLPPELGGLPGCTLHAALTSAPPCLCYIPAHSNPLCPSAPCSPAPHAAHQRVVAVPAAPQRAAGAAPAGEAAQDVSTHGQLPPAACSMQA